MGATTYTRSIKINPNSKTKNNRGFLKILVKSLPFANLAKDDSAVENAFKYLKSQDKVDGNAVWEIEHKLNMSKRSRNALEDLVKKEFNITKEQIKSNSQYKDYDGTGWGNFQGIVNSALNTFRLNKIFGNLEIYKGKDGKGLDFDKNTYISPEGSSLITALMVAGPAAVSTSASIAGSVAGYAKFSTASSFLQASAESLKNNNHYIMGGIAGAAVPIGIAAMYAARGNPIGIARGITMIAQKAAQKLKQEKLAKKLSHVALGLGIAAMYSCSYFNNDHSTQEGSSNTEEKGKLKIPSSFSVNKHNTDAQLGKTLAEKYAYDFEKEMIVWHDYGTQQSNGNELKLLAHDGTFKVSDKFTFDHINGKDLAGHKKADYLSSNVNIDSPDDLVLRLHADLNGDGKIAKDEWGVGTFNKEGTLEKVYDAKGNEVS
ncbi:MAG: hypothetical protein N3D84_03670, partial [Candidatus Woesearchaeota archaeon]|nr:hypothetical protein [Candidatus Woesearchaeota archaeon]